ncbi:MAG: hypothetical protein C4530_23895 [Desulfobacteraceae bacterium]|nr:MAG: hypothetical protein C4530_23895 [Desulfobacteraceae bacterium]
MARHSSGFQHERIREDDSGNRLIVLKESKSRHGVVENQNLKAMKYNNSAVRMYKVLKGGSDGILRFLDRAIQIDPLCEACHLNKAVILYNRKEYVQALESSNQAVRINPQNPKAYLIRAKCNLKLNLKKDARYDYKRLCELGRMDFKTLMEIYKQKKL